jgi:hypothetical protein
VIIKVIAINKNFSAIYNFTKSEVAVLFNFLFNSFKYFVFNNDIAKARVILIN